MSAPPDSSDSEGVVINKIPYGYRNDPTVLYTVLFDLLCDTKDRTTLKTRRYMIKYHPNPTGRRLEEHLLFLEYWIRLRTKLQEHHRDLQTTNDYSLVFLVDNAQQQWTSSYNLYFLDQARMAIQSFLFTSIGDLLNKHRLYKDDYLFPQRTTAVECERYIDHCRTVTRLYNHIQQMKSRLILGIDAYQFIDSAYPFIRLLGLWYTGCNWVHRLIAVNAVEIFALLRDEYGMITNPLSAVGTEYGPFFDLLDKSCFYRITQLRAEYQASQGETLNAIFLYEHLSQELQREPIPRYYELKHESQQELSTKEKRWEEEDIKRNKEKGTTRKESIRGYIIQALPIPKTPDAPLFTTGGKSSIEDSCFKWKQIFTEEEEREEEEEDDKEKRRRSL